MFDIHGCHHTRLLRNHDITVPASKPLGRFRAGYLRVNPLSTIRTRVLQVRSLVVSSVAFQHF